MNILRGDFFERVNIFRVNILQGWIFFRSESFSGVNIFQSWIVLRWIFFWYEFFPVWILTVYWVLFIYVPRKIFILVPRKIFIFIPRKLFIFVPKIFFERQQVALFLFLSSLPSVKFKPWKKMKISVIWKKREMTMI